MLTFSVNKDNGQERYKLRVKKAIEENKRYFQKFNGEHYEEAIQATYIAAITNRNDDYEDVLPYIKALARNILKTETTERPYDMQTEDGEVSAPFLQLVSYIDDTKFLEEGEIERAFQVLYLEYEDDFLKLGRLFEQGRLEREAKIKKPEIHSKIRELIAKYGASVVFYNLYNFLQEMEEYKSVVYEEKTKLINIRKRERGVLDVLSDLPTIKTRGGRYLSIDKNTLEMEEDPDYVAWDMIAITTCTIRRVDLTPLMDYMYKQVYVEQGVDTRHIKWCGEMYRLMSLTGDKYINEDREVFLNKVRVELVENLLENRIGPIIAISPDSVYIKPTKAFAYTRLRLEVQGKTIDLPITEKKGK